MAAARSLGGALGKLNAASSALFVCDIQERFRPAISGFPAVIDTARRMVRGANVLGLPVVATEQVPTKLGPTVKELVEVINPAAPVVAKTMFSMVTPEVEAFLASSPAVKQLLLCGIETHVCVLQTSLDLLERGYEVHVLVDGVSSQRATDRDAALRRLSQSGCFLVSSEMCLFQLIKDASAPGFKQISSLVKEPRPEMLVLPGLRL